MKTEGLDDNDDDDGDHDYNLSSGSDNSDDSENDDGQVRCVALPQSAAQTDLCVCQTSSESDCNGNETAADSAASVLTSLRRERARTVWSTCPIAHCAPIG